MHRHQPVISTHTSWPSRRAHTVSRCCLLLALLATLSTAVGASSASAAAIDPTTQPAITEPTSFGVSPGSINIADGARNARAGSDIIVFNKSSIPSPFEASAAGEIAGWVRFGPTQAPVSRYRFSAQPGRTEVPISISIPPDARNGNHEGVVRVTAAAAPGEGDSGVTVTFEIPITVTVAGEQRVGATYSNLTILATEIGEPAEIRATVANTGNVTLPVVGKVEILRNGVTIARMDSGKDGRQALPGKSVDLLLTWDTRDALPGDYTVIVDVAAGDTQLGRKQQTLRLESPGRLVRALTIAELVVEQSSDARPVLRGRVTNTGQIAGRATLSAVVSRGGLSLASAESTSFYIAPGQTVDAIVALPLLTGGTYKVASVAELPDYRSPEKATEFSVANVSASHSALPMFGLVALVALTLGVGATRRSRRRVRAPSRLGEPIGAAPSEPTARPLIGVGARSAGDRTL